MAKSFKSPSLEAPEMQFITNAFGVGGKQEQEEARRVAAAPKGTSKPPRPRKEEAKTKRVQVVMKPSLYESAKKQATQEGLSLNGYINYAIETALWYASEKEEE